jgi:hypothetical protein
MGVQLPIQNPFIRSVQPTPWVRAADWPVITDAANEVQYLFSDINDASCSIRTQFTRNSGSQNLVIDWGDGTTDTVTNTAATITNHVYTPGTGTPCSRGYTTFKIRVYFTGTGSSFIFSCTITGIIAGLLPAGFQECCLLEAYYGQGTQTAGLDSLFRGTSNNANGPYTYLEYVKLPNSVTGSCSNMFNNCTALAVVVMPTSGFGMTTFTQAFTSCSKLQSITFPSNATSITNLNSAFNSCISLTSVTLPPTLNSCTNISGCFSGCSSLKNVTVPSLNTCTNIANLFSSCFSLEWVKFNGLPSPGTPTAVSAASLFSSCYNLQNVYFPSSCSSNAIYAFGSAFSICPKLRTVVFPTGLNATDLSFAFNSCYNLTSVTFQSPTTSCTAMNNMFSSCYYLKSVTLPSAVSASGVNMQSAFQSCTSLADLTINSSYLFTSLVQTFNSCTSLKTLNWSPGVQNSLVSLSNTFANCSLLESITLPTSMNSCTTLTNTFSFCFMLRTVTFPSTMNSVTNMSGLFNNCRSLTSVTLPTSTSACTDMNNMFGGATNITTVTLPSTVSASLSNMSNMFFYTHSLKTVTFPNTQITVGNNIGGLFYGCSNLTTINNFNRLGPTTSTPLVTATGMNFNRLASISFTFPLSRLELNGFSNSYSNVQEVRLTNAATGQWTGTSPQINVSYTNMSTAQLVQLFNDMAAQGNVTSKTINITSATGAAGLSAANRLIITSKGWTITG